MDTGERNKIDELIDLALEESFPASDPRAFMAASAVVGAPKNSLPQPLAKRESDEARPPTRSKKAGN
jgi:hypothetical protein